MKNLIIIGAGGMGRSLYDIALNSIGYDSVFKIKGFIDDNLESLKKYKGYPKIINTISDYIPQNNDVFSCSIGDIVAKKNVIETLVNKGASFISLIHKTALVDRSSKIGIGVILGPFVQVGASSEVGDYCLIQSLANVGHDVRIGNLTRIDTLVTCIGGVYIGNEVTIHSSAILNHNVIVENNAIVGANSFVIKNVKSGTTVFGSPARKIF